MRAVAAGVPTPSPHPRRLRTATVSAFLLLIAAGPLGAQYFGRNKVPYERFRFEVIGTPHFDVHYYGAEKAAAGDAARMLERWNARYAELFNHKLSGRKSVILYADRKSHV